MKLLSCLDTYRLFVLAFVLVVSSNIHSQQWIDVTDTYVKNPSYVNNDYSFWEGTSLSSANPSENAEHYGKNYDTYQVIKGLTPGKYRVSLDAFYRMGSTSNDYSLYSSGDYKEYQYAKLYASSSKGDYEVGISPCFSGAVTNSLGGGIATVEVGGNWWGGGTTYYVPNTMEAAYYWFEAGYYDNSVECEVGSDGELTIGIRKNTTINSDWTCIDNWKLEYYGTVKKVTSVSLSQTFIEMYVGGSEELTCTVMPSDATYRKVSWSTSNESIASVSENGTITANAIGTATITATATDGSGVRGICRVSVKEAQSANSGSIVINEIMASNIDVYRDPSTNFGSWVELYNPSSKGVKLGGLYVSDDVNDLRKHKLVDDYGTLPPNGYALLNFDHHEVWTPESYRQIDDKLDCDGGTIIISDGTEILAQQDYPQAIGRVSYARKTDGGNEWGTTGIPSPGASNAKAGGFATEQLPAPEVSRETGLFSGSFDFQVTIPAGTTLRYTTNGSAPTLTNGNVSTNGKFTVKSNSCYRFRLFRDGYLPSKVVTRTFISSKNEPFPIISIVTDKNNLDASSDYGVFKQGQYGRPGNGQTSKCNWNMDWDRPVNFEFITTDNECVVSQECDFSMCGGWSRAWTPHSFKLKATKVYDFQNTFEYQFFDEKPFLNNKTLQIRNGGNDSGSRIKDAAVQQIAARSGIYVDYQSWQPVHVFINGQSYAVLNMREPNNKHYAYANYGIDTDEMEQFEISPDSGYVQMTGTGEYFKKLCDLATEAWNDATFEEISELIDIDEYVNYMAIQLYAGGTDWPQNNVKGFVDQNSGKFHFVLFDMDFALNTSEPLNTFKNKQYYNFDTLHGYDYSIGKSIEGTRRYNKENEFVTLFLNMLKNDTFRKKFIDTFCIVGGSVYTPERVSEIVNEMASYLSSGNYVNPWGTANDVIRGFSDRRSAMISHLQSYFSLSRNDRQEVTLASDVEGARLLVNDIEVPTGEFAGTLFAPITYKAIAPAGYTFVGWAGNGAVDGDATTLIKRGESWGYSDENITSSNWKTSVTAFRSSGRAPLGYGKSGISTTVAGYNLSYYFGKNFTISGKPSNADKFILNYTIDDGFIVYVNGQEAARYNMPSGNVGYNTAASTYCQNNPDEGSVMLSASLFKEGSNYIAVEVHNNSTSSSDILWDADLTRIVPKEVEPSDFISTDAEFTVTTAGTYDLLACFEPIDEDSLVAKGTTPVKINEVSAANTMAVNDLFKKKDWIELYNTTDETIDVAGMYISDKADKPQKYQIPQGVVNTVIEPHGHLVIWADEKEGVSQLHVPFKLGNNEGEQVILTSEDGSWSDVLTYTMHLGTQSVGLYPDGSNNIYVMDAPTIGANNKLDSYASFYMLYVPVANEQEEPNTIAEVASDIVSEHYYNVGGAFAGTSRIGLPAGIYVVRSTHADGKVSSRKLLVK